MLVEIVREMREERHMLRGALAAADARIRELDTKLADALAARDPFLPAKEVTK